MPKQDGDILFYLVSDADANNYEELEAKNLQSAMEEALEKLGYHISIIEEY